MVERTVTSECTRLTLATLNLNSDAPLCHVLCDTISLKNIIHMTLYIALYIRTNVAACTAQACAACSNQQLYVYTCTSKECDFDQ